MAPFHAEPPPSLGSPPPSPPAQSNPRGPHSAPQQPTEATGNSTGLGVSSPDTAVGVSLPDTASAENVGALSPDTAAEANRCLFELRWALSGTLIARVKLREDHMVGLLTHQLGAGVFAADGAPPVQLSDEGCRIEEYRLFYEGTKLSPFQRFKHINIAENGIVTVVKVKIPLHLFSQAVLDIINPGYSR